MAKRVVTFCRPTRNRVCRNPTRLSSMDAAELAHVQACQRGELDHFDALYTQHVDALYRYLSRRVFDRQTAEDLTSITFMKALEGIRSFTPHKQELRAWLYRIARNSMIDHFRKERPTMDIESAWDLPSDDVASLAAERSVDVARLHKAMQKLNASEREIVMLRIWEGLSYREIAEMTGKTEANSKVIFSRAVKDLRTQFPGALALLIFLSLKL